LPASTEARQARTGDAVQKPWRRAAKETILIVEDEPVLRDMAHLILQECGYSILEAASGVEALQVWQRNQDSIDLVLTDMVMPEGISGMELAQKLHENIRAALKIVFASGYSMDEMDSTFFAPKVMPPSCQKPYTHVTLAKAVRAAWINKRLERCRWLCSRCCTAKPFPI